MTPPKPHSLASALDVYVDALLDRIVSEVTDAITFVVSEARSKPAPLLDRQGLAAFIGISLPTVDRLRREGLPTLWVVESPRFDVDAVREWLTARANRP